MQIMIQRLDNGDDVAVIEAWAPTSGVSAKDTEEICAMVRKGKYLRSPQSPKSISKAVMRLLNISLVSAKAIVQRLLRLDSRQRGGRPNTDETLRVPQGLDERGDGLPCCRSNLREGVRGQPPPQRIIALQCCDPFAGRNSQVRRLPDHTLPLWRLRPRPAADGPG